MFENAWLLGSGLIMILGLAFALFVIFAVAYLVGYGFRLGWMVAEIWVHGRQAEKEKESASSEGAFVASP